MSERSERTVCEEVEATILAPRRAEALLGDLYHTDDYTAYVEFDICKTLPNVMGPESKNGAYFGVHPAVLARSYKSMLHKQLNLNHRLKAYGTSKMDRIVGAVIAVAYPPEPEGGWQIAEKVEDAPSIRVLAVMHKLADGVSKVIGEHLGGKEKWSVSMEVISPFAETAVWQRSTGTIWPIAEVPAAVQREAFIQAKDGTTLIGKYRGEQLVSLDGGLDGKVKFLGVGMTTNPAEETAQIVEMRAEGFAGVRAASLPGLWVAGQRVTWKPLFRSAVHSGKVEEVYTEGVHTMHGDKFLATYEDPILKVRPDGRAYPILRRASGVEGVRGVA